MEWQLIVILINVVKIAFDVYKFFKEQKQRGLISMDSTKRTKSKTSRKATGKYLVVLITVPLLEKILRDVTLPYLKSKWTKKKDYKFSSNRPKRRKKK